MLKTQHTVRWLPILVGTALVTFTILLWQALQQQEKIHINRSIELGAKSLKNNTEKILNSRVLAQERMAQRWNLRGRTPREEWESDATNYVLQYPTYQAIGWTDSTFHVRWIVPQEGNEEAHGLNFALEERLRIALEQARDLQTSITTRTIDLVQGGKGFIVYTPLYVRGALDGFIFSVFRVKEFFDFVLSDTDLPGYSFTIFDGEEEVYSNNDQDRTHMIEWGFMTKIKSTPMTLHMLVWPTPELFAKTQSILPKAILGIGFFVSLFFPLTLYLTQIASLRTKQVELSNQKMRKEIIARKLIGEELLESRNQFRMLAQVSPSLIFQTDAQGKAVYVNKRWSEISGLPESSWIGEGWIKAIHPLDRDKVIRSWMQAVNEKKTWIYEFRFMNTKGDIIWVLAKAIPILSKEGKNIGFMGTCTVITDIKNAEKKLKVLNVSLDKRVRERTESLRDSEERYHSIIDDVLDSSKVGVCILNKEFRVEWINKAMGTYFGLIRDELIGKDLKQLIGERISHVFDDGEKFKQRVLRTYDDNTYKETFICHVIAGDKREERWLEHWSQPITSGFYAGGRVEFYTDITHIKHMQEELLLSEKLKAMGVITAGIAHEFNNILAIIKGYAQLIKLDNKNYATLTDGLHTIIKASDDGASIVHRMKEFVTVDANTTCFESVDINVLIKHTINYLRPKWYIMAGVDRINYHVDIRGLKKVSPVIGKPSELREVLANVINNALEAMPNGGTISFKTWSKGATVFASISDTGKGMSLEVQNQIFDPFFTTRMPEGTGLGMSAAYGIIKKHGGETIVKSELGKGSTITLSLPVAKNAIPSVVPPKPPVELKSRNCRILVVDDIDEIRRSLDKFLSKKGYIVWSVTSGHEAIQLLNSKTFDFVLCGLIMPDGAGHDVIKAINTLDKRPKVGLITGWLEKIEMNRDENFKIDFILRKPFDFSELSKCINNTFSADKQNHKEKEKMTKGMQK